MPAFARPSHACGDGHGFRKKYVRGWTCSWPKNAVGECAVELHVQPDRRLAYVQGGALWPYLRNPNIYVCPDDLINYDRTYSLNGYLNGEYESPARTLSDLRSPTSGVFCFIEKFKVVILNTDLLRTAQ